MSVLARSHGAEKARRSPQEPAEHGSKRGRARAAKASPTARRDRYRRLGRIRRILPGERIARCGLHVLGSEVAIVNPPAVRGVESCGSPWACPVCAVRIGAERGLELGAAVERWGYDLVGMLTLTIRHHLGLPLESTLGVLKAAWRRMWSGRPGMAARAQLELQHTVAAIEVTWSPENGWHPHLHVLAFRGSAAAVDVSAVLARWSHCVEWAAGQLGVRVSEVRPSTPGAAWTPGHDGLARYVSKLVWEMTATTKAARRWTPGAKGFSVWDLADSREDLFREYYRTTHGKHRLQWSRGAQRALGVAARGDSELADAEELREDETIVQRVQFAAWVQWHRECRAQGSDGPTEALARLAAGQTPVPISDAQRAPGGPPGVSSSPPGPPGGGPSGGRGG